MALAYANPAGSAVLLGNLYTAVWEGHAFSACICFLCQQLCFSDIRNQGRDCGRFWGEGKLFCFRNVNRKILNVCGIHLVFWGHFTLQIKGVVG